MCIYSINVELCMLNVCYAPLHWSHLQVDVAFVLAPWTPSEKRIARLINFVDQGSQNDMGIRCDIGLSANRLPQFWSFINGLSFIKFIIIYKQLFPIKLADKDHTRPERRESVWVSNLVDGMLTWSVEWDSKGSSLKWINRIDKECRATV